MVLYGNHDDYDNILPHYLGDYGIVTHGGVTFGYFRGEYSIDKERRVSCESMDRFGKTWWEDEEMRYSQMLEAIDFFTKIALKNQVDDLLDQFDEFYQGTATRTMSDLRRSYDFLMMKVLSLLQDDDQKLASAIVSSREAIWSLLADPKTFATLRG